MVTRCIDSIHYYPRQTLGTINCEDDGNRTREQHGTVAPPALLQVRSSPCLINQIRS